MEPPVSLRAWFIGPLVQYRSLTPNGEHPVNPEVSATLPFASRVKAERTMNQLAV